MSFSITQSRNNSTSNNINEVKSNLQLNSYAKNLKHYFISLKSERDIAKILKSNKYNKRPGEVTKNQSNNKPSLKRNTQDKFRYSTPIEFFEQIQDIEKETKEKIEKEQEKKIKKQIEEEKINIELKKEKKKKEKLDSNKKKYDNFWKKVKYYIDKKNEHLSEITYKLKLRNDEEMNYSPSKMNKTSIQLYPKSRKPLYRHKNINERLLNKELNFFYSYCQKERRDNNKSFLSKSQGNLNYLKEEKERRDNNKSFLSKSQGNLNYLKEDKDEKNNSENKYQNFYGKKLNWLKKKEDKNELRRKYLDKANKRTFSFKPNIDKKSIKLVKQRNSFLNFLENKFNTDKEKIFSHY